MAHPLPALLVLPLALTFASARASAGSFMNASTIGAVELDGDSTLHKYSAKTRDVRTTVELDGAARASDSLEDLLRGGHVKSVELTIPVQSLTSGEGGLDRNLWKALKSDRFHTIRLFARVVELTPPTVGGAAFGLAMRGSLSVAGVERPVVVTANGFRAAGGIRLVGSKDILMSDYQIKAPTLMLGAIKTANLVVVKFDVEVRTPSR